MSIAVSKDTQLKRARLYPDIVRLPLDEARVCLNCDTVHSGDFCPVCASGTYLALSSVIGRLSQNSRFERKVTYSQVPDASVFTNTGRPLMSVVGSGR